MPGVVRIDPWLARLVSKNGFTRGALSIQAPHAVLTAVDFQNTDLDTLPYWFAERRSVLMKNGVRTAGASMVVPVNHGRLVVGDRQHLVLFAGAEDSPDMLTLHVTFIPSDVILKLASRTIRHPLEAEPVLDAIQKEINDPGYRGRVCVITPDTHTALTTAREPDVWTTAFSSAVAADIATGQTKPSALASLAGQWIDLAYQDNRLCTSEIPFLCSMSEAVARHDLYILLYARESV
ncbi:MAG TPA: hypothetical protein PLM00_03565 [Spirochaetota bacterium]|nr:hypothetical protein [Spirochaetota bacterium]HPN82440.1 hypothetical protein [Spirochaetota bacterium]